ncbi:MAG: hypothetical protein JW900_03815 [Anaerolineae bacterium]|nr:hypothetical protein [Anaerolineae bacterium]
MHKSEPATPLILRIPPIILTRAFYLWVFIVAFLNTYPLVSAVLAAFLLLNLVLLKAQRLTWKKWIRQDRWGTGAVRHTDQLQNWMLYRSGRRGVSQAASPPAKPPFSPLPRAWQGNLLKCAIVKLTRILV